VRSGSVLTCRPPVAAGPVLRPTSLGKFREGRAFTGRGLSHSAGSSPKSWSDTPRIGFSLSLRYLSRAASGMNTRFPRFAAGKSPRLISLSRVVSEQLRRSHATSRFSNFGKAVLPIRVLRMCGRAACGHDNSRRAVQCHSKGHRGHTNGPMVGFMAYPTW